MVLIDRDKMESLLGELLQEDVLTSRKSEILQELRVANQIAHEEFEKTNKQLETLKTQKEDLVVSNSMLFRKLGSSMDEPSKVEEQKKTFSETITLDDLI